MNLISIIHVLQRGHAVKRKRFELAFQSAYQSEANNVELYGFGYRDTVHKKGRGNKLLSATNLDIKIKKSKICARFKNIIRTHVLFWHT